MLTLDIYTPPLVSKIEHFEYPPPNPPNVLTCFINNPKGQTSVFVLVPLIPSSQPERQTPSFWLYNYTCYKTFLICRI